MQQVKNGVRATRVDDSVVEAVREAVAVRAEPDERQLAVQFARLFLNKAPPEFSEDRFAETLALITLESFRFLQKSLPDRVNVEVTHPDLDSEGWHAPVTVIRTNVSERPFIVDTIREYLHSREIEIARFIYPVMHVERDADGRITELGPASEGGPLESLIYCEVARIGNAARVEEVRATIERYLQDVVRATDDFVPMLGALGETAQYLASLAEYLPTRSDEIHEVQEFLRWLREGGFVFLGYRAYDIIDMPEGERALVVEPESGMGILENEAESNFAEPTPLAELPADLRERVEGGPLLIISKTNARATVHRRVRMDYIGVKKLDSEGRVVGERRFIGLFTSQAYSEDAERIPILREKLRAILDEAGAIRDSHDYKEIITIFNSMPKEELFLTSAEEIGADIQAALALYHTHEVKVTLRPDPLDRGVAVMAILPKEKFSGDVRQEIEGAFIERFSGEILNYHLALGGGDQARLHFYISADPERIAAINAADLEREVRKIIRSWSDRLREGLEGVRPGEEARRLAARYGSAFSAEYRAATEPEVAEQDIFELEEMAVEGSNVSITLTNPEAVEGMVIAEPVTELKLYLRGEPLVLSDFMPILDNAGLRVIAMQPFDVLGPEVPDATIYVFAVQDTAREPVDIARRGNALAELVLAVRAGHAANDALNALALSAGLAWREIDALRAYAEYAFQLGAVPSRASIVSALRAYPDAARLLVQLFSSRFDPAAYKDRDARDKQVDALRQQFVHTLDNVVSLSDDRALRRMLVLIDATVRTNYYRHGGVRPTSGPGAIPYMSMKFDARALRDIADTKLLYEIWVHSARMAGIHLRGARVARGGVRFSDRPDDFRKEVLGLVKTQVIKNAVIVPSGSKGGFVIRNRPTESADLQTEIKNQYRTYIRGLLDITDNLVDGEVKTAEGVLAYDEPDPYLVVAADKGTAHLSDVANRIAADYGFWLGDAFASGGSHGYDHKRVGITARGGWECVRRHFHEMGKDIQEEAFTVVGIGDMSGDVFGNGMLLSPGIRLIAAFDHRHVFIDPDPDPESSFRERKRLFEGDRTTWDDYNRSLLSDGGMIVYRGVKEVDVSPQARAALGLTEDAGRLDGESLIRAVLAAPVDLLWNGGIGTYVKASGETHAAVGDSANDAVRIDAEDLRARVIGEGGNLGLTQRARIEFAMAGGRLNTDALDNSGGVDMSDREVNLKILLNGAVDAGNLTMDARNALLEDVTPAVTDLVLNDNSSQSLAVSLDEIRAKESADDFQEIMLGLEREGLLDRTAEVLPTSDALAERYEEGAPLTRPELCVLLACAKLDLKRRILAGNLPDDPAAEAYLGSYFPEQATRSAGESTLMSHRLRREIVASQLANDLVDLMGAAFVHRVARDTGRPASEVARAWLIASRLSAARELRATLAEMEGRQSSRVIYRWLLGLTRTIERTTRWVLGNMAADVPTTRAIDEHVAALKVLRDRFGEIVAGEERALFEARVEELRQLSAEEGLARRLITLRFLDQLLEILRVAHKTNADPVHAGRAYYRVSELLSVPWLRDMLYHAGGDDRWDQRAAQALLDDLGHAHRELTALVVEQGSASDDVDRLIDRLRQRRGRELARFREILNEIRAEGHPGLAALSITVRELQTLSDWE